MEIKGVENLKNNLNTIKSYDDTPEARRGKDTLNDTKAANVELQNNAMSSKIKNLMLEMKGAQDKVSEQQSYLESLNIAKNKLLSSKNLMQLFEELIELRNNARFNAKPLMESVIPEKREFYNNNENIKEIKNKVADEIEKTRNNISASQQQLSRFSISLENIKASLNSAEIKEMQSTFHNRMLYKNFNKELVISLMS